MGERLPMRCQTVTTAQLNRPLPESANEAYVEHSVVFPFLTEPAYLSIEPEAVRPKEYLAPTRLDKESGKRGGYFPDYSVWIQGFPLLIVEAKDPTVAAEVGFREACLYARHLNSQYPSSFNPCKFVIATNGTVMLAGYWDQADPIHAAPVADLAPGTAATEAFVKFCSRAILEGHALTYFSIVPRIRGVAPYSHAGGQALINSKFPLNSFAPELSPILRKYFSSTNEEESDEITERAYVSSEETTEYDRILEALLKERASPLRDSIVRPLRPSRSEEPNLTQAINAYNAGDKRGGQLQIIQGGVGSGKSLFVRRYRKLLQPHELRDVNSWVFIDFNQSPPSLAGAERWLCEEFIKSFEKENPSTDLYSSDTARGVFSRKIQQRRASYELLRSVSEADEIKERAKDIAAWQSDWVVFAEGVAGLVVGGKRQSLIVVMDNVDKLELDNQLAAFQLSLWFMARTNAFIILQMRDETYERFKNRPPLDTFRSGITFHISAPRFIDVVKRRLELGIEFLAVNASNRQEFTLENGVKIIMPKSELGNFLKTLYQIIFGRRSNVARVLEALSGRDVRKALSMFVSIVTSGHLSTSSIMSTVKGGGAFPITERHILRIVMRTDYRFFSDNNNSNITNIFFYDNDWPKADNFILIEILFFLSLNRKINGELGLEGYFSVRRLCDELQRMGYPRESVIGATSYLLKRELIIADNFHILDVDVDHCVRIQASGYIHLRILSERIEYVGGVMPVTPIADDSVSRKLATFVNREAQRGDLSAREKVDAVKVLMRFLRGQHSRLHEHNPFFDVAKSGALYVLAAVEQGVEHFFKRHADEAQANQLDLI